MKYLRMLTMKLLGEIILNGVEITSTSHIIVILTIKLKRFIGRIFRFVMRLSYTLKMLKGLRRYIHTITKCYNINCMFPKLNEVMLIENKALKGQKVRKCVCTCIVRYLGKPTVHVSKVKVHVGPWVPTPMPVRKTYAASCGFVGY